jgi:phosphoglycerol transferase MdoB-like AlkP superfamily enzyme
MKSLVFPDSYSNGQSSMDAVPSIIAGLPAIMEKTFIFSKYSSNKITSLADILKNKGYQTSFFHGGINGTMGFDAFSKAIGCDNYYGKDEYSNDADFDGKWGIYDEEFLQYFANTLNSFNEPFFSCIITLSSHHPYTIPKRYNEKFPRSSLKIHRSIRYADYSLKRYFETVSKMPWYKNTLFVLTADHTEKYEKKTYRNKVNKYAVPLVFFHPGDPMLKGIDTTISQQADILPSVLDYLNYNNDFVAFGNSVFDTTSTHFAVNYSNGIYQLIEDNYVLHFDGKKSIALYNLKSDPLLKNNLRRYSSDKAIQLETKIKGIIQAYNSRMIKNQLTIK